MSRNAASYAAIEITRVSPCGSPTRYADGNTENASTNVRQNVIASPGANSGNVIRQNRCLQSAPSVAAACSSVGSIPDRYDSVSRNANGKPVMISENTTPQ